jgi:phage terminase large subunit GpA-like protein
MSFIDREFGCQPHTKSDETWALTLTPRTKRKTSLWAETVRRIAAGQSPLSTGNDIPYRHEVAPHAVEPMDAVDDPAVNTIVLWWGRRMGKTEGVCGNVIGRTITDNPCNILDAWPVEDSSDRYSRDVIEPMIAATPELDAVFVEKKSRDSGRTIDYKRFIGGSLYIINAGSKSKMRGMAASVVLLHEVDAYPTSSQGEGDPIAKALGRSEGFGDAIKIIESTGTFAADIDPINGTKIYHSNIEMWFDRSDQRKWFCPCRGCGAMHWLKWEQIKKLDRKSGQLYYYVCQDCDIDHNEAQWRKMVSSGTWKATAPFLNGIRGYWINGFNSLLPRGKGYRSKLHQFAVEGERALAGKPEEKQVWINEVKTELVSVSEGEDPPAVQAILDGREDYATEERVIVPKQALVITTMTDMHPNRLEVEWRAWAKNEESWGLGHFVIFGNVYRMELWDEWSHHLQKTFQHELGGTAKLNMAFLDSGWNADSAIAIIRKLNSKGSQIPGVTGKIMMSKGVAQWNSVIYNGWGNIKQQGKGGATYKGVHIGTWRAKSIIYERLRWHSAAEKPSEGYIHFGKIYSDEFIRQTVSEKASIKIINGKEVESFKNPEANRNEALDLLVGNLAAFRLRRWDFQRMEKELIDEAAIRRGEKQPELRKSRMRRVSGLI